MTPEELNGKFKKSVICHEDIILAVRAALAEERDEFWVPQPQHYLDHQMMEVCRARRDICIKNQEWVASMREGSKWTKRIGLGFIVTSVLGFILWAITTALESWRSQ